MLQNYAVWLILRFLTSLWVALVSPLRPQTLVESSLSLLSPDLSGTAWLDRVLLAPWVRWDVDWYIRIATSGYQSNDGTLQFHPLFPWIASFLYRVGFQPVLALLLISSIATLALYIVFERLALLDLSLEDSRQSVLILAFFPISAILFAPYSESLFLLWSVLCFIALRKQHWVVAGIAGFLASLTRQQGLFLIIPLVWGIWETSQHNWRRAVTSVRPWIAPIITLLGYLLWVLIRRLLFNESMVVHEGANTWIYTLLVSPSANQVVPHQAFLPPWQALGLAINQYINHPDLDMSLNFLFSGIFLVMFIMSWGNLQIDFRLYCITIILVSLCYYTGPVHPYMGLPRHLMLAFPVFIGFAPILRRPLFRLAYVGIGVISILVILTGYSLNAWVP